MKNTFSEFVNAYQKAPQVIQQIIDSEAIGVFVDSLLSSNSLPETIKRPLMVITSNRLLGIIPDNGALPLLQEFIPDAQTSAKIDALIRAFVRGNIDGLVGEAVERADQRSVFNEPVPIPQTTVPTLRTMAQDMSRSQAAGEQVYTSTQEAILKEGWSTPKPAQQSPQPPQAPPQKWG